VGDVDTVVVNAPAGASATLDTYASVIDAVARDVGATLAVSFCLGPSAEVVSLLDECLAHGLLGIPHARRAIVLAGFLGDPAQWPWSRAALRDRVSQQGVREFVMPRLTEYVMSQVRTAPGRLNDLAAAGGGLTIASRSLVYRWLRGAAEVADFILGEETVGERDVA
jgi:hypothetical protein